MERESLLVNRVGGMLYQILSDEEALIVVPLGHRRDGRVMRRTIDGTSQFDPTKGMQRILRTDVALLRLSRGWDRTELCLSTVQGAEYTWHMSERLPDEGVYAIFHGLNLMCSELDSLPENGEEPEGSLDGWTEASPEAEEAPRSHGGELLLETLMASLGVLLPALWWINHSELLFWLNLAFLPAGLVLLARQGRLGLTKALWLLPGAALALDCALVNLADPRQVILPTIAIAAALTLMYALLCGRRRKGWRTAAVFLLCLTTYAPGAAMGINSFGAEPLRTMRVNPSRVQYESVEIRLEGETMRLHVPPEVTRRLSVVTRCTLQYCRGSLGIEYWVVSPPLQPDQV